MTTKNIILIVTGICLIFFGLVAIDFFPFLRGPGASEWRWPYLFVNTLSKIWMPLIPMIGILGLFFFSEKKKMRGLWTVVVLGAVVLLSFAFQLSVVNFSRAGIKVLYHRTTDPGLNGYYTAGLSIKDPHKFLINYPLIVNNLPMHAKGHPPGGPLFYYFLNLLLPNGFYTAIISSFLISSISCLAIPLIYLITKDLRSAFLAAVIPAMALFLPLLDAVFPLFGLGAYYLYKRHHVVGGAVFALGLFFSYSLLPLIIFFRKPKFFLGLALMILIFYFFGYNFFQSTFVIISNQAHRSLLVWEFFNPWDFIVFLGFPIAVLAWLNFRKKFLVVVFFILMSIFSRAEVGRIWLPLMLMAVIPAGKFLQEKKFPTKFVMIILALQMIQTLVIQEFWVPLW